jgi:hypothetical protein
MVTLGWPFFCFMAERSTPPARRALGIRRPRASPRVPLRIYHLPPLRGGAPEAPARSAISSGQNIQDDPPSLLPEHPKISTFSRNR